MKNLIVFRTLLARKFAPPWHPVAPPGGPTGNLCSFEGSIYRFDSIAVLLGCLVLAAGLGLGLVVGLGLGGFTSTLVAALHGCSERLLAGFDALSGVPHARAPEETAD